MPSDARKRRLWWHGILLFLLGLVTGALVPVFTNPRMGLSAHLAGVQSGIVLVLFGFLWPHLALSTRQAGGVFWSALYGLYAIWIGLLLAAALGTSQAAPIAGAGFESSAWQEGLVYVFIGSGSVAILVATVGILYGLRSGGAGD